MRFKDHSSLPNMYTHLTQNCNALLALQYEECIEAFLKLFISNLGGGIFHELGSTFRPKNELEKETDLT